MLLTRDEFRNSVFERDHHRCVVCGGVTDDMAAHHIIDRKLFKDGGYYLDNGATLCKGHHWDAETNRILPDMIRTYAKIKTVILPEGFDPSKSYDKWGAPL